MAEKEELGLELHQGLVLRGSSFTDDTIAFISWKQVENFCAHQIGQEWEKESAEDIHTADVLSPHFITLNRLLAKKLGSREGSGTICNCA